MDIAHMAQFTLIATTYLGAAWLLERFLGGIASNLTCACTVHVTGIDRTGV